MHHASASFLPSLLLFLGAAVVAVPVFKRIGLGAILGYLVAGVAIGPSGLRLFTDTDTILQIADLGIVLLLFVIGLELQLSRLLAMRRDIFGLGALQLGLCALGLGAVAALLGLSVLGAAVAGIALALSATAIALQVLNERGELQAPYGQRSFAVLLFQDISIVPILALVPLFAVEVAHDEASVSGLVDAGMKVGAVAVVVLVGRYLLNPMFRILANTGAREVMTAAALLLVLGTALLMQFAGMSMALGAFLAGVLLAESNFRHELEADIEPFRGLLLGLFFMGVGMAIDGPLVLAHWPLLAALAIGLAVVKSALVAGLFKLTGSPWRDAFRAGVVLSPAGEFAFVLIPLGRASGFLEAEQAGLLSALAATTMLIGPLVMVGSERLLKRFRPPDPTRDEDFSDAHGRVLMIGFGRFGQIVAQIMRTQEVDVTIIDNDVEMIDVAARFGSKVYFGDGTRLDVLRAAGAGEARIICVMIDDRAAAARIVELVKAEFPLAKVHARAYDRQHALALLEAGVDYFVRETYESAMTFGRHLLETLDVPDEEAEEVIGDVRERDAARLAAQMQGGIYAGMDLIKSRRVVRPEPLEGTGQIGVTLNADAIRAVEAAKEEEETG
ncbi:monovalent cation:proton antiporter-2 (CPA2) family protein [Labrys wisconsinensis]|uniref:CPA2 family monovalent cation:H+ antiporter-2/glutathione-regulated potassium-efflux system protein KefB n=1 Tax=Labrys wisconsinensis TaxID=425677 RepID=A0ABU0J831_9HYPH|nr:monovalent cation:proton antiporter-2 (CPA2) family protein [Labrys wisconsinensis]MDQ0470419.1 CPA2 family monovalent cation:H+ antiporter-2/glutathione-regulated potassium-efflux system protein KefB [Labrys wisconsinensis]